MRRTSFHEPTRESISLVKFIGAEHAVRDRSRTLPGTFDLLNRVSAELRDASDKRCTKGEYAKHSIYPNAFTRRTNAVTIPSDSSADTSLASRCSTSFARLRIWCARSR